MVLDPHSAVGVAAARDALNNGLVDAEAGRGACLCASGKFPDAVARATGQTPVPQHLADLMSCPEQMATVSSDPAAIAAMVEAHRRGGDRDHLIRQTT